MHNPFEFNKFNKPLKVDEKVDLIEEDGKFEFKTPIKENCVKFIYLFDIFKLLLEQHRKETMCHIFKPWAFQLKI